MGTTSVACSRLTDACGVIGDGGRGNGMWYGWDRRRLQTGGSHCLWAGGALRRHRCSVAEDNPSPRWESISVNPQS